MSLCCIVSNGHASKHKKHSSLVDENILRPMGINIANSDTFEALANRDLCRNQCAGGFSNCIFRETLPESIVNSPSTLWAVAAVLSYKQYILANCDKCWQV